MQIPEIYKKISLAELKDEEKRISKTLDVKKTGTVREKIEACPIKFYL